MYGELAKVRFHSAATIAGDWSTLDSELTIAPGVLNSDLAAPVRTRSERLNEHVSSGVRSGFFAPPFQPGPRSAAFTVTALAAAWSAALNLIGCLSAANAAWTNIRPSPTTQATVRIELFCERMR